MENPKNSKTFPSTHWSQILDKERRQDCLQELCLRYHQPCFYFLQREFAFSAQQTEEILSDLYLKLTDSSQILDKADPGKGKFRNYLLGVLKNIGKKYKEKENRRAKTIPMLSEKEKTLFTNEAEKEANIVALSYKSEDIFNLEWAKTTVNAALKRLESLFQKNPQKRQMFRAFQLRILEKVSIEEVVNQLHQEPEWISDKVYQVKIQYKKILTELLLPTVDSLQEVQEEIQELMTILSKE
jgi:DNA-directed RNA polymerase specialized sigma24 family protein